MSTEKKSSMGQRTPPKLPDRSTLGTQGEMDRKKKEIIAGKGNGPRPYPMPTHTPGEGPKLPIRSTKPIPATNLGPAIKRPGDTPVVLYGPPSPSGRKIKRSEPVSMRNSRPNLAVLAKKKLKMRREGG